MLQRAGGSTAVLSQAQQRIQQAEASLQRHEFQAAQESAQAASAIVVPLQQRLQRIDALGQQLQAAEDALARLPAQQAATVRDLVQQGRAALQQATQQLSQPESADATLNEAEWLANHAFKLGPEFEKTKRDLGQRTAALQEQLPAFEQRLERGRQEFDIVDEFAPSSWSDIRGNGSEATAAVQQAQQLLGDATTALQNPDSADWNALLENVETAEARLKYADQLLSVITTRLHDLREAQKKAASEVDTAQRDIKLGWGYVRNNDADVGKEPEVALQQAETLLSEIQQAIAAGRPDWLQVLQKAAQVRQLADKALAGARSEVENMNALRKQVQDVQQTASAELNKLTNFAQLHPVEVTAAQRQSINSLGQLFQQAQQAVANADRSEEDARIAALNQAFKQFSTVTEQAHPLYAGMYESFQKLETLRTEANTMTQTARQSLDNTAAWYNSYGHVLPAGSQGRDLLAQAQQQWRPFNPQASADELQRIIDANKQANTLAHQAAEIIQKAAQTYQNQHPQQQGTDFGDLLTGMVIGQMLGGGQRHRSWGGGFGGDWGHRSGGGSSGGGSFGGGGGGIFGGGGGFGGGGSFGGGGGGFGGGGGSSGGGGGSFGGGGGW